MVFVISKEGEVLMPTKRHRKVRQWLSQGQAKVISRAPFTVQLLFDTTSKTQPITLGVDTGHNEVGLSAVSQSSELFSAVASMRNDISKKMSDRKMYRRNRRNRLRYRKPRFLNRKASSRQGRLAPSVQWKVDAHAKLIHQLKTLMPITKVVLETGTFDPHKLKHPEIKNEQYQKGVQYGYENVKAYVLSRDSYKCQCEKKGCTSKLEVHHIIYRSQGGSDSPSNLITLCSKHHESLHNSKWILNVKRHKCLKSATTMNIIRSQLLKLFPDAVETFGYVTKANRYQYGIEKSHANDAFVIAGGTVQKKNSEREISFKRKNNRSIQKNRKGFSPSIRRQRYTIQPKDWVQFEGKQYQAIGMQNKGAYLKMTNGLKPVVKSMKKIEIIFHQKGVIYV